MAFTADHGSQLGPGPSGAFKVTHKLDRSRLP